MLTLLGNRSFSSDRDPLDLILRCDDDVMTSFSKKSLLHLLLALAGSELLLADETDL